MSFTDEVALAGAERIHRSAGDRAGLIAYRALASRLGAPARGVAILKALECSVTTQDLAGASEFVEMWDTAEGPHFPGAARCAHWLWGRGHFELAWQLAVAESKRFPSARAFYLAGRVCSNLSSALADWTRERATWFERAHQQAKRTGEADLERAALVDWGCALAALSRTRREAETLLKDLPHGSLTLLQKWDVAAVLLASGRRFVRASGLAILDELAKAPQHRSRVFAVVAAFVDERSVIMSPLEFDRARAIFSREVDSVTRAAALVRLEEASRWRSLDDLGMDAAAARILAGASERTREVDQARLALAGKVLSPETSPSLRAIAAFAGGRIHEAEQCLRERPARSPTRRTWAAIVRGLGRTETEASALGLFRSVVARGEPPPPPPMGFVGLARLLPPEDALLALRLAQQWSEPDAVNALQRGLVDAARAKRASSDLAGAYTYLREARSLPRS